MAVPVAKGSSVYSEVCSSHAGEATRQESKKWAGTRRTSLGSVRTAPGTASGQPGHSVLTVPTLEGQLRGLYAALLPYTVVVGAGRSLGVGGLPQNSFTI